MKQLLRIDVEPLSEQRWEKIERSLIARLEREARQPTLAAERRTRAFAFRPWVLALTMVAGLAVAVLAIRPWSERATLEHPSRITTGHSPSHLALPGLALDVEPESAVVVSAETPKGLLIVLDRGGIVCQVAPRSSESPLIVQAGEARIVVVGTRFGVTRLGETARVVVHEGVVEVTSRGQTQQVRAGEQWPAQRAPEPDSASRRAVDNDTVDNDESAEPPPVQSAVPAEKTRARTVEKTQQQATAKSKRAPSSPNVPTAPETAEPAPSKAATDRSASRPSSQAMFEEATRLERSDPARASRLYRRLETGSDSWAQNALYARGRLEASRGNSREARRLLESYLQRFPRGSNVEDARAMLRRLR